MSQMIRVQNSDGQLAVDVKSNLFTTVRTVHMFFTSRGFATFALIILAVIDGIGFYQIANKTIPSGDLVQFSVVIGFVAAFELAPLYLGYAISLKAYGLGNRIHKTIFRLSLMSVLIGIALNGCYRWMSMEVAYSVTPADGGNPYTNPIALPLTVLLTFLPVITSMVNIVIGCLSFDPLLFDIRRIKKRIAVLSAKKWRIDSTIAELSDEKVPKKRLEFSEDQYSLAIDEMNAAKDQLRSFIRTQLREIESHAETEYRDEEMK